MAFVRETIKNKILDTELEVVEMEDGNEKRNREPYEIIDINIDSMDSCTPDQLVELGEWFIEQGKRIKKEYDRYGKKKRL